MKSATTAKLLTTPWLATSLRSGTAGPLRSLSVRQTCRSAIARENSARISHCALSQLTGAASLPVDEILYTLTFLCIAAARSSLLGVGLRIRHQCLQLRYYELGGDSEAVHLLQQVESLPKYAIKHTPGSPPLAIVLFDMPLQASQNRIS